MSVLSKEEELMLAQTIMFVCFLLVSAVVGGYVYYISTQTPDTASLVGSSLS